MSSGLRHIDVGPELTRTEWESQDTHQLMHGTAFPAGPVERQLFYRDDLHQWFIYNGTDWDPLQAVAQIENHRQTEVHVLAQPPADHDNAAHTPNMATEADLNTHVGNEAAGVHGSAAAATPDKLVHRDAHGRAKVVDPDVDTDVDTRGARNQGIEDHRLGATHALDQPPQDHDNTRHTTNYASEAAFNNHSARHELAGADVLNVAGLSGALADDQPPAAHDNTKHTTNYAADADLTAHEVDEAAGVHGSTSAATAEKLIHRDNQGRARVAPPSHDDDIDTLGGRITGIGVHKAAEVHDLDQPPQDHDNTKHTTDYAPLADFNTHAARHELAGMDQIGVAGLSGELADDQPPKLHDNTKHSPDFAEEAAFNNHSARHEYDGADEVSVVLSIVNQLPIFNHFMPLVSGAWTDHTAGGGFIQRYAHLIRLVTSTAIGGIAASTVITYISSTMETRRWLIAGPLHFGSDRDNKLQWFGFLTSPTAPALTGRHAAWYVYDSNLYASCGDGTAYTQIDLGPAPTSLVNSYIFMRAGAIDFYLDNVLVATITTNLPPSGDAYLGGYIELTAGAGSRHTDIYPFITWMETL